MEFLDSSGTTGLPLGIIVNKYVVFHCQFEVWDLFAHPTEERKLVMRHRIHSPGVCGSRFKSRHSPYGLDDFMSSIVVFVLKTGRDATSDLSHNE